jgi:hypothetical protein
MVAASVGWGFNETGRISLCLATGAYYYWNGTTNVIWPSTGGAGAPVDKSYVTTADESAILTGSVRHSALTNAGGFLHECLLHAVTHLHDGTDPLNVHDLSGKLADEQNAGWIKAKAVDTPVVGDDLKFLQYNHGASKFQLATVGGGGDMTKAVYDTDADNVVESADNADMLDGSHAAAFAAVTHKDTHKTGGGANAFLVTDLLDGIARVTGRANSGANTGSRRRFNFLNSATVTWTLSDVGANEEITVSAASTAAGSNYYLAATYTIWKDVAVYRVIDHIGGIAYSTAGITTADAADALQWAQNSCSSGGVIVLPLDFDADGQSVEINQSNLTITTFNLGNVSAISAWTVPRISRLYIHGDANRTNIKIEGLNFRELDVNVDGGAAVNVGHLVLRDCYIRPDSSTAYHGIRVRGTGYLYFFHIEDCKIADVYDTTATGRGAISLETVNEGNGQWIIRNLDYKPRTDNTTLFYSAGRNIQTVFDTMSFVVLGTYTGCQFARLASGARITDMRVISSLFELHQPVNLFTLDDGVEAFHCDFSHNTFSLTDTMTCTFLTNNTHAADLTSDSISGMTVTDNYIKSNPEHFVWGTLGLNAEFFFVARNMQGLAYHPAAGYPCLESQYQVGAGFAAPSDGVNFEGRISTVHDNAGGTYRTYIYHDGAWHYITDNLT